jgi:hypothetical protein
MKQDGTTGSDENLLFGVFYGLEGDTWTESTFPQEELVMESKAASGLNNWGMWLIQKVIHPLTIFGTPLFILALMIHLVSHAFYRDTYSGIRSFAAVLLPLIVVTFIFIFQRELLERLGRRPTLLSFSASLIAGIAAMAIVRFCAYSTIVPVSELVLSGSFSILVFSYVSLQENKMLSYYYGMICGFLVYIIFFGFPVS